MLYWNTCHNFVGPDFFSARMTRKAKSLGYPLNLQRSQFELKNARYDGVSLGKNRPVRAGRSSVCTQDRYGSLNLRTGPSLNNRVIRRIPNGSAVRILRSRGNWSRVRYRGIKGRVSIDFICSAVGVFEYIAHACGLFWHIVYAVL